MHRSRHRARSRADGCTLRAKRRQISIDDLRRTPRCGDGCRQCRCPSAVLTSRRCSRLGACEAWGAGTESNAGRIQRAAHGDRFIVAGFGVGVQGDRKIAGKLRAATLVAADRPNSQQLTLIDPQKLGEAAGFGVCNGDSGGPVLDERDRALVGIVSWSARTDGEPICGFMSGVIPLARYRYWILETAARLGSPLAP